MFREKQFYIVNLLLKCWGFSTVAWTKTDWKPLFYRVWFLRASQSLKKNLLLIHLWILNLAQFHLSQSQKWYQGHFHTDTYTKLFSIAFVAAWSVSKFLFLHSLVLNLVIVYESTTGRVPVKPAKGLQSTLPVAYGPMAIICSWADGTTTWSSSSWGK